MQDDSQEGRVAAGLEVRLPRLGVKMAGVKVAEQAFLGGNMKYSFRIICGLLLSVLLLGLHAAMPPATGAPPKLAAGEILGRMERRFETQMHALASYQARRSYSVEHGMLSQPGTLLVEEQYCAPGERTFRVLDRGGPSVVQEKVFSRLLEVEQATAAETVRQELDLNRRNYRFTYERYDPAAGAYVFAAEPRGSNPYRLRGRVWINAQDFAVQRIEGEPVKRHSVFVRQTHFVHEFARFGEFWFPVRHRSETDLALFGRAVLRINYFDYHWQEKQQQGQEKQEQAKQEVLLP
jgi:hypothetical protein